MSDGHYFTAHSKTDTVPSGKGQALMEAHPATKVPPKTQYNSIHTRLSSERKGNSKCESKEDFMEKAEGRELAPSQSRDQQTQPSAHLLVSS